MKFVSCKEAAMHLRKKSLIVIISVFITASLTLASVITWRKGKWPGPWPKQLKEYQQQAMVIEIAEDIQETVFEISFEKRDEFEKAWPEILELKTRGAPLILEKGPSEYKISGTTVETGVRILWPSMQSVKMDDGTILRASPIDFSSLKSPSGGLPEYVIAKNGKWVPYDDKEQKEPRHRARVDIVLITDANIVDLNRIPLPANTPIIDRRFSK
jgi:hypothetical protein